MSGYLARLKNLIRENRPSDELTELTKGTEGAPNETSVSFVSNGTRRFPQRRDTELLEREASTDQEFRDDEIIEERAGLASESVPSVYLDVWARLNHRKPARVSETEWRFALDDGGRFLDAWGSEATEAEWTPGELFDCCVGLVWRLGGARVEAIGPDHARLSDGRILRRSQMKGGA